MRKLLISVLLTFIALPAYAAYPGVQGFGFHSENEVIAFFKSNNNDDRPCFPHNKNDLHWLSFITNYAADWANAETGTAGVSVITPAGTIQQNWSSVSFKVSKLSENMSCGEYKKLATIYASVFYNDKQTGEKDYFKQEGYNLMKGDSTPYPLASFIIRGYLHDGRKSQNSDGSITIVKTNKAMIDIVSAIIRRDDISFTKVLNIVPDSYINSLGDGNQLQWRYKDNDNGKSSKRKKQSKKL